MRCSHRDSRRGSGAKGPRPREARARARRALAPRGSDPRLRGKDRRLRVVTRSHPDRLRLEWRGCMAKVEADIEVQRFGYRGDDQGRRLRVPARRSEQARRPRRARRPTAPRTARSTSSRAGSTRCAGRPRPRRWAARGCATTRAGSISRSSAPSSRAASVLDARPTTPSRCSSPHVTFSELRLTIEGPVRAQQASRCRPAAAAADGRTAPGAAALPRQPVGPHLPHDQGRSSICRCSACARSISSCAIPIQEGSLDYRALDDSLDWLEGTFLDIKHEDQRLKVQWKVPIVGSGHDLITWALDNDAVDARVVRPRAGALARRLPAAGCEQAADESRDRATRAACCRRSRSTRSTSRCRCSRRATSRSAAASIMFGGEDQPGMVDLKVTGAIRDRGPGTLQGRDRQRRHDDQGPAPRRRRC